MWQATELVYLGLRQRSIVPTAATAAKPGEPAGLTVIVFPTLPLIYRADW